MFGVPDGEWGERVHAAVRMRGGHAVSERELMEFCRRNISRYKVPKYVQFVDAFPLTASGKIQKFVLRERAPSDFGLSA